ncbi:hypothetical protein BGZ94_002334 [Podila epigama]|nr:hypothetical protein BGZ94_002334 [Podila epigama]
MPIIRSLPVLHTFRTPRLDLNYNNGHPSTTITTNDPSSSLSIHGAPLYQNDYPPELFQVRAQAIQTHLDSHYPSTAIYLVSLATVVVFLIIFVSTLLALHVSDGKPWVLGVIVIMILVFISKMTFLSRMEKANKQVMKLLQTSNEQDMPRYSVLYRLRRRNIYTTPDTAAIDHTTTTTTTTTEHTTTTSIPEPMTTASHPSPSFILRVAHRLNLDLPCWMIDLTTIDHIDEFSFHQDPALDPHASVDEILARENELPTYQPKENSDDEDVDHLGRHARIGSGPEPILSSSSSQPPSSTVVLCEALPPQYDEIVIEMSHTRHTTRQPNPSSATFSTTSQQESSTSS